jgi:4-amino-4-deoxy-L-arabinose transferase-like glycosyltransferase
MLLGIGLYLPLLGAHSLLDPWESHYGEVAREMLARDDWISLWWGQEGWFWSKPVLDFWLQGLSFALLGVKFRPDEMLSGAAHGHLPQPEWAARLPVALNGAGRRLCAVSLRDGCGGQARRLRVGPGALVRAVLGAARATKA